MHPTVAALASAPNAAFTFTCRPCNRLKVYRGSELVARVGSEETFESLKARTVCPKCQMPVDGCFRTFEFSRSSGDPTSGAHTIPF